MAPYYRSITAVSSFLPQNQDLLEKMEKSNADELKRLDERLADAEKTEGESEISDALKARANYLTRIGDKVDFYSISFIPVFIIELGAIPRSTETRRRENPWSRFQDWHRSNSSTHWSVLRRYESRDDEHIQSWKVHLSSFFHWVFVYKISSGSLTKAATGTDATALKYTMDCTLYQYASWSEGESSF